MSFPVTLLASVLILVAVQYLNGVFKKGPRNPALTPDGMWVLLNPRQGMVCLVMMVVIGLGMLFLGCLCFADIGFGQGGVVFLFFLMGAGIIALGFLFKALADKHRLCYDQRRIIRYHPFLPPVEMEWWEIVEYNCNPRFIRLKSAGGQRISIDCTYDGFGEFSKMVAEKIAQQLQSRNS